VIPRYVCDAGALIAVERRKARALSYLHLACIGRARLLIPLSIVAEWWRGRTDDREDVLAASEVVASLDAAKAAGIALGRLRDVHAKLTIDAVVIATAALADATVLTADRDDFARLAPHFPGVTILSV
jgi:predicted nucleic acid-binding protein